MEINFIVLKSVKKRVVGIQYFVMHSLVREKMTFNCYIFDTASDDGIKFKHNTRKVV